jgi:glycosyltransferase involved in cell wall biosynthesis
VVQRIPDDALVLLDGLIASTAPEVLVPQARRLRLVVLVHMSLGHCPADDRAGQVRLREGAVLSAAAAVVTTSAWTRRRLMELHQLPGGSLHVAEPGVDPADLAAGTDDGGALLCLATVTFLKGQDLLIDALQTLSDLSWHCVCAGRLDRDPGFVEDLRRRALEGGMSHRLDFVGALTGADLDRRYAAADLVVLASRVEAYGMVVTEAVARGLPVVAADVGGVSEALGRCADGSRPGVLVPPGDAAALGAALRDWLGDADLRGRLRRAASERRESLSGWSTTASVLAGVLDGVSMGLPYPGRA